MKRIHKLLLGAICVISPVILAACYGPQYYPEDTLPLQGDTKKDGKEAPANDIKAGDLLAPDAAKE